MLQNNLKLFQLITIKSYATAAAPAIAATRKTRTKKSSSTPTSTTALGEPLIACKRTELNLFETESPDCKFGSIPLASKGWLHHKSKDDFFILKPRITIEERLAELQDIEQFMQNANINLYPELVKNLLYEFDIKKLTNVQVDAIPKIYNSQHVLIAAETGCGKTMAYLLPIVQKILDRKSDPKSENILKGRKLNTPIAIILTPGRELASQIGQVAQDLSRGTDLKVKTILGGNTKRLMTQPEFEEVDILVASIGALSKLLTTGIYRIDHVRHVILDEADTLLDDSFTDKLCYLLRKFPFHKNQIQDAQTVGTQLVLASATMPTNTDEILNKIIDVQTLHEVTSRGLHQLMPHVEQRFLRMNKAFRPAKLLEKVKKELAQKRPIIVFSNKSAASDYVSIFLNNCGVKCLNLNGDMLMKIRLGRFEQFQSGECNVLSTTDVASRGLDTTRAQNVINFDFPLHISDYIHRCGRIGRINSYERCVVTNFISSRREVDVVQRIEHAARCGGLLPDVNANIKNIINKRIIRDMALAGIALPTEDVGQGEKVEEEAF